LLFNYKNKKERKIKRRMNGLTYFLCVSQQFLVRLPINSANFGLISFFLYPVGVPFSRLDNIQILPN
jgi:hypothetical protein